MCSRAEGAHMTEEKERILKLILEHQQADQSEDDPGVDYSAEYQKQTGKDLETGIYVTQ